MSISPRLSEARSPQQAERVAAEERHEADCATKALEAAVDRTDTRLQRRGSPGDRRRAVVQEPDQVAFFWGQLRLADGLAHRVLLPTGFEARDPHTRARLLCSLNCKGGTKPRRVRRTLRHQGA